MTAPYFPPVLATPIINPRVGGFIRPVPYLSLSQYRYAPTAMDVSQMVPLGSEDFQITDQDQMQSLQDVIRRASGWIDRFLFGAAEAAKGASLCASQSVGDGWFKPMANGMFNLQCDYDPIISLDACAIGGSPTSAQGISQSVAQQVTFGRMTIYVPVWAQGSVLTPGTYLGSPPARSDGKSYAVWAYTSGYPHTSLAEDCDEGDTSIVVNPTGPGDTLAGLLPGMPFSIDDASWSEDNVVESVVGTTVNLSFPLAYDHTVPPVPDFLPVTCLPADVQQAAIFLVTALIKSRGDLTLELSGVEEAKQTQPTADATTQDVAYALNLLEPFRSVTKQRS